MNVRQLSDQDLSVLIRALHEARFPVMENDPTIWLAPFVVDLHVHAVEEEGRRMGESRGTALRARWRYWSGREEHQIVLNRIRRDPNLRNMISNDPAVMRDLLRPFVVDDESLREFVLTALESDSL